MPARMTVPPAGRMAAGMTSSKSHMAEAPNTIAISAVAQHLGEQGGERLRLA